MFRHSMVVVLLLSNMACIWIAMAGAKSFEKTRYPNGTVTCAIDEPSLIIPLDQLSLADGESCVAPGALCASQCLKDPACTNYNYRKDLGTCELFHYTPSNCSAMPGCSHAEVSDLKSCQLLFEDSSISSDTMDWSQQESSVRVTMGSTDLMHITMKTRDEVARTTVITTATTGGTDSRKITPEWETETYTKSPIISTGSPKTESPDTKSMPPSNTVPFVNSINVYQTKSADSFDSTSSSKSSTGSNSIVLTNSTAVSNFRYSTKSSADSSVMSTTKSSAVSYLMYSAKSLAVSSAMSSTKFSTVSRAMSSTKSSAASSPKPSTSPTSTKSRTVPSTTAAVTILPPPTITSGNPCDKKLSSPNYVVQINQGFGLDQDWQAYKYGFSDANGGYWMGNENVYQMTNNGHNWNMCADVQDVLGLLYYVSFSTFIIDAENAGYTYFASGMQGAPLDPLGPDSRKYKFTTKDRNNQPTSCANQAQTCKGGWWWSCSGGGMVVVNGAAGGCGFRYSILILNIQIKRSYIRISQK